MSDPARAHLLETWQTCQQAALGYVDRSISLHFLLMLR